MLMTPNRCDIFDRASFTMGYRAHRMRKVYARRIRGINFPRGNRMFHDRQNRADRFKAHRRHLRRAVLASLVLGSCGTAQSQLPTGADVVAGQAAIAQAGNALDVNATTSRAIVNWDSFNVGAGNVANFNLPDANSAILNRVTSANMPSTIAGAVNSNGNVYLVNPSGIVVSSSGMVNTNGFTASTFDIANQDFMAGGALAFANHGSTAAIVNEGTIHTGSGGAHLIANEIANHGTITSVGGNITLSGGGRVTLENGVTYSQPSFDTLASGISPTAGLIQNTGTIRATGAATTGGEVYLVNPNGRIMHDGTIAAVGQASSLSKTGDDRLEAYPTVGGHVQLEADEITLTAESSIDASGTHGGGTVLVGGGWQGGADMHQATSVTMESGAIIDASAIESGDGGTIVLWSDIHNLNSVTKAFGTLIARAGEIFGDGGQIETSGHVIDVDQAIVDAGATVGNGGLWLIDPYNWIIGATNAARINSALNSGTSVTIDTQSASGPNSTANNNGTVDNNNAVLGDIQVNSAITKTSGGAATLRLNAANSIIVNAAITSNSGALNVTLDADNNAGVGDGGGIIVLGNNISTNGGNLRFGTDRTANLGGLTTKIGGDVFVTSGSTLSTAGGSVEVSGETILGSAGGLTINSGGGNVTFDGVLNSGNNYQFITGAAGTGSWSQARVAARNGTAGGAAVGDSYLVAISSRLENAIASSVTLNNGAYRGAWIGVHRPNPSSSYNWVYAGGPDAGETFFVQSGGGGGSALPGAYSNFGSGEPNGALNGGGESAGQFFGSQALWNDLSDGTNYASNMDGIYNVMGYVRETNLAPAPLTINAGSGNVTFNAGVGTSKALSTLNITAGGIRLNGGTVNTAGTQTYNAPVILGAHTNLSTIQSNIVFGSTVNSSSPASPWHLNATITPGNTYYWVDWTNYNPTTRIATGTITVGSDVITVTYSNPQGIFGAQTNGGTNYWTGQNGGGFSGPSPYVSAKVANGPTGSDIIQLQFAGSQSLTFSQSVENLAFSVVSLNGNGYGFNQDFEIQSFTGLNGASPGFWGTGALSRTTNGSTFNLNGVSGEPHGTIRFGNAFSQLTWNSLADESWNGFTVGVSGTSNTAGRVQFNGAVGGSAALGAINVNGAMQTNANIVNAGSLNVTGLANLGGNITTSGNQTFGSAITLGNNVGLTSSGGDRAISTIAGNHRLDVNVAGSSSIDGAISGSGLSLVKSGTGTLTLSGTNTYTGATTINGGGLSIASDANLGTAPGSVTASHLTLDGGTLIVTGNTTLSSNRGIALGANHGSIDVASGRTLSYGGIISGTGNLTKSNTGTLNLSGVNTYAGNTSILGGTLQTNNAAALGSLSRVTLGNTAGANLSLLSNLTIGSLSGGGTLGGNVALGNRTLTTGSDAMSTTYAGVISGTGSLFKAGVGEFTLLGNHTYTGATTIGAGSMVLRNNAPTTASSSFQGPGTLTIESVGNSFTSPLNTSAFNLATGTPLGGLTIGKSTNTAAVTIGSAQTIDGNVQIHGGSIAVNAGLTSLGGGTVSLHSGGNVTDGASGFISADNLLVNATGTTTLDSNSNSIGTFASDGGGVTLVEANGVSVGIVGTTTGINSTGNVDLATLVGDLTVGQNISTSSTSASAIRLNAGRGTAAGTATGGNLILSGSPTVTVGSGGRATLMTGGIAGSSGLTDLIGSGSGRFRYNSDEAATNYSLALGSGLHAIYREGPSVTMSTGDQSITYGDTPPTVTASLSSVNGDTVSQIFNAYSLNVGGGLSSTGNRVVGNHAITQTVGSSQLGYAVGSITGGTFTVAPKALVVDLQGQGSRVYDGTTTLDFSGITPTLAGIIGGDAINVTAGTVNGFSDKHVGTNKSVDYSGFALSGADASNYAFSIGSAPSTASITGKSIVVSGLTGIDRVYDGGTTVDVDHNGINFAGMIAGDSLNASATVGTMADRHVGTNKSIMLGGTVFGGADAGNYTFDTQTTSSVNVTPKAIGLTGIAVDTKVYDRTTVATLDTSGVSFVGQISGDDLNVASATGVFADKNVGSGKLVTLSGLTFDGTDRGNYTITDQATALGNITPRSITVGGILGTNRIYDGTMAITLDGSGAIFNGMIDGDDLRVTSGTATLANKHVGNGKSAAIATTVYGGADLGNYAINDQTTTTVDITSKSIIVGGITANDRIYDGTFDAGVDLSGLTFIGLVSGDVLSASGTVGTFTDKNVGTIKTVTLSGTSYGGSDVGNYSFTDQTATIANITAKAITVSGLVANDRAYDGTTDATVNHSGVTFNGMIVGDDLTATGTTGQFAGRNVAINRFVTLGGTVYGGIDVGNYIIADQAASSASISAKNVTITAPSVTKVYDGNTGYAATTAQLQDLTTQLGVIGDTVDAITLTYENKNVGTGKTLTPSSIAINDGNGGLNYNITLANDTTGVITRLGSVTWIGGTTGDWNDAANWSGGAIPDLANVANVIIPFGVTPTFGTNVAGPVQLDTFTGGNFKQDGGTLNVAGPFVAGTLTQNGGTLGARTVTVENFAQNGGGLNVNNDFHVNNTFNQSTSGTVQVGGTADITHRAGPLAIQNLSGGSIKLDSTLGGVQLGTVQSGSTLRVAANGNVTQSGSGTLTVSGPTTITSTGGIDLGGPNNDFVGPVNASGSDITISDASGGLTLGSVSTPGTLSVTTISGGVSQTKNSQVNVGGSTTLVADGDVNLRGGSNGFTGPLNITADNAEITQTIGNLVLGTLNIADRFWTRVIAGGLNQSPGGAIAVGGTSKLTSQAPIKLTNTSNQFQDSVTVNAPLFDIRSTTPFAVVRAGASLASDVGKRTNSETVNDTIVRPADAAVQATGWVNQVIAGLKNFFRESNFAPSAVTLNSVDVDRTETETFIRPKS